MVTTPAETSRVRYQSRPGRLAVVAASLADLKGPADRTFDLSQPFMLRSMYEAVLGEASRPEDLATYLDGDTLIALWPDLFLPKGVRQAWEDRHPVLRAAAVTAA